MPSAAREADDAVQPRIAGVASLEQRRGTHVVQGRIDVFAAREAAHYVFGTMPVAVVLDIDQRAIGSLQCIARIEVRDAVVPHHLPVGAAGEHPPRKPGAIEAAADDADNATPAKGRLAELLRLRKLDAHLQEGFEAHSLMKRNSSRKARGGLPSCCSLRALRISARRVWRSAPGLLAANSVSASSWAMSRSRSASRRRWRTVAWAEWPVSSSRRARIGAASTSRIRRPMY